MKILIVDDEVPIRKYITQMITECGEEYEVTGSVSSAKKALEVMKNQVPDLVFADITMPKMNGLELLEQIKAEHPEVTVFMLTCHNDFEFARTAIKLQADNYILKDEISLPFMENLLRAVQEKRKKAAEESLHHLESDSYFIQLMEGEETLLFDSYDLEKHKIFLKDKAFMAISFSNSNQNLQKIISFRHSLLQNQEIFPYHEYEIILIANLSGASGNQLHEVVQEIVNGFRREVNGPVGASSIYYRVNMLRKAVMEACESYSMEYYGKLLKSGCQTVQEAVKNRKVEMQAFANRAHYLIQEKNYKKLFELVSDILAYAVEANVSIHLLKQTLYSVLSDYAVQSGSRQDFSMIKTSGNMEELQNYIFEAIEESDLQSGAYSQAVNDALWYMQGNFGRNLTLTEVAESVHLNQDYFSRRFKKETGKKFSEYLLQLRMEAAQKLILETDRSITDVARDVGFNNDSYFSVTYKKVYGENPNETRKNR
ncbi:response regulator [Ruminococcus sp. OA3]|uniref:response regulator transcription factor n=1 Tax=Ruminococcus sp. OA3 TaxID=2914164 RepID=UPI001F070B06|nr:response regulator [Ruminococcus sp. OA3]MCH1981377.1 response regulator [Ruminococcus sp. OA3]